MTAHITGRTATAAGLWAAVATLYCATAARTVVFIDSGELATVAWTLGIAHPTGYPLFTLVAWIASHLPAGTSPVFRLNILSALLSAAGAALTFLLASRLAAGGTSPRAQAARDRNLPGRGADGPAALAAGIFGALTLAFSGTYWTVSASVEVYPLHVVFLASLIMLFLAAFPREGAHGDTVGEPDPRLRHLFAFVLGLSFCNHMSTIYLAPAFLTLYARRRGAGREAIAALAALAPAFILGLSAYLYLPVRASSGPLLNWGDPSDAESLLRHLGGKQYSVWIFSSAETAGRQLSHFFSSVGPQFLYVPPALGLWGMLSLWRRDRDAFLLLLLLFAGCLAFAVNYDIHDIDAYFLLAHVAVALAASAGLYALAARARGAARTAVLVAAAAFLAVQAGATRPAADLSGLRVVDQYARSILEAAEEGGIVISYQWDYFVSASYYLQLVEGVRPDVAVVDKELIRRSWYIGYLRQRYPMLLAGLDREVGEYLRELSKFESGAPYDPRVIEFRYAALIAGIISRHEPGRAVYVTPEIEPEYTPGYRRVPHGLAFRLRAEGEEDLWTEVPVSIDPPIRAGDRYVDAITMLAARSQLGEAAYLERHGLLHEARRSALRALAIRPDDGAARSAVARLGR
jgi:hypothetical protein